jgi:SHS2 domain-containing protein
MKTFEVIDISGDAGIRAYGETVEDLFSNAALGLYSLITNPEDVGEVRELQVAVESRSMEGLLVAWLNELIFHFDTYGFVGKKIMIAELTPSPTLPPQGGGDEINTLHFQEGEGKINALSPGGRGLGEGEVCKLRATVSGEDFDLERHERKLLIKAATYHMLKIEKKDGGWVTDVIFDI